MCLGGTTVIGMIRMSYKVTGVGLFIIHSVYRA